MRLREGALISRVGQGPRISNRFPAIHRRYNAFGRPGLLCRELTEGMIQSHSEWLTAGDNILRP